jgi:hypothetical protein
MPFTIIMSRLAPEVCSANDVNSANPFDDLAELRRERRSGNSKTVELFEQSQTCL